MGSTPTGTPPVLPWLDEDEPKPQKDTEEPTEDEPEKLTHQETEPTVSELAPITPPVPPQPPRMLPPEPPRAPRRRVRAWVVILILVVVIALVVATLLLAVLDAGDRDQSPGRQVSSQTSISAELGGLRQATFDLVSSAESMRIGTADLGDQLYRVSTPAGGGAVPKVLSQGDRFNLQLVDTGQPGPSAVDIQLSNRVQWSLRTTGGAKEITVDARGGGLTSAEFAGGATTIDLTLPRAEGTMAVRMSGGASQFTVRTPTGIPAQVRIDQGASRVSLYGDTHSGISPGSVFKSDGWDTSVNRYDVEAVAGVGQVTVAAS